MEEVLLMDKCMICSNEFTQSPDSLVLCDHYDGFVHRDCCVHKCSKDGKPCEYAVAIYDRVSTALN